VSDRWVGDGGSDFASYLVRSCRLVIEVEDSVCEEVLDSQQHAFGVSQVGLAIVDEVCEADVFSHSFGQLFVNIPIVMLAMSSGTPMWNSDSATLCLLCAEHVHLAPVCLISHSSAWTHWNDAMTVLCFNVMGSLE